MQLHEVRYFLAPPGAQFHAGGQTLRRLATFADERRTTAGARLVVARFLNANRRSRSLCLAARSIPTSSASRRTQILHATRRKLW